MTPEHDAIPKHWTVFGPRPQRPRPSVAVAALALIVAWPVMTAVGPAYPAYMIAFVWLGAGWCTYQGMRARALLGLLFVPVALLWLNPFAGADWFTHEGPVFFLAHATMALLLGTAAYTYLATEKR